MPSSDQISPSLPEFRDLARDANLIPIVTELVADSETPISVFGKIQDLGECFLFESAETNEQSGRFSFIGFDPLLHFESKGRTVSITERGKKRSFETDTDPVAELETILARYRVAKQTDLPHFNAGAVGYIGFDVIPFFEPTVTVHPRDDLRIPEMSFMIARVLVVFDHRFRRLRLIVNALIEEGRKIEEIYQEALARSNELCLRLSRPLNLPAIPARRIEKLASAQSNFSRDEFEGVVGQAREYIAAGDIFQVVLSQRFETDFPGDALDLYRSLRFGNPSPYMFMLKFDNGLTVLGSSPEMHLRVRERCAEIRPIAGTRPRGKDADEDDRLGKELLADPKERAEHVMLIDLGRNDLGRVSKIGTVRVTEQMTIERYSHVMHIVSHVVGEIAENKTGFDALRATFPAGTVSGAPKVRAMQIITELEKSSRGFYSGVVGYFGIDGSIDTCIALRSIVLLDGRAYLQTGAGIVADSDPGREYEECVNKSKAMLEAIERARAITQ
jgi:anthranilate synthase component 1